jgi:phosphatidylglycerophosphate synthase
VNEFSRWSLRHALAIVVLTPLSLALHSGIPLAAGALLSFGWLVYGLRDHWTTSGAFGLANAITSLRLLLTLSALVAGNRAPAAWLSAIALIVVSLDGVDGWAARRFATQGDFGARYDTAVDSLFTLALSVLLYLRAVLGPWVLIAGAWHYVYVLSVLIFPSEREAKRSLFGASVFVGLVTALGAAFVLPAPWAALCAGLAIAIQSASFSKSFWERYGP